MDELTPLFKALSDKNRLRILLMLEVKPMCVCEITHVLGLAPSTVSKHLSILKEAGFIFQQKENKWVNYHLNRATQNGKVKALLSQVHEWLKNDSLAQKDKPFAEKADRQLLC